jgi:predicted outer membrane repeat protein
MYVVSCAGNDERLDGNEGADLDELQWYGDSGAIIVGGGKEDAVNDRFPYEWSAYGSRVNVQGWGRSIYSTGYGDEYDEEGEERYYTSVFGGTSGAGAQVAAAVTCCVGFWKANVSAVAPSPLVLRAVLEATGTPQKYVSYEPPHIGPRPNLRAAFEALADCDVFVMANGLGDYPTIEAAIDGVPWGSVIGLGDGVYTGAGNTDVHVLAKMVTVRSISGDPTRCVIDCQGSVNSPHRGFWLDAGHVPDDGIPVTIEGLTIKGGYASSAGGGGLRITLPQVDPLMVNPMVRNCVFESNYAADGGGAISIQSGWGGVWIEGCRFNGNVSGWSGGAVAAGCPLGVAQCAFSRNWAERDGGAIDGVGSYGTGVSQSIFLNNVANRKGGAISLAGGELSLSQCSFHGNVAAGGDLHASIELEGTSLTIERSIVSGSRPGAAVLVSNGSATATCCDIWLNEGGDWVGALAGQLGHNGNFSLDPRFCDPGAADLHLASTSPCLPPNTQCELIGPLGQGCTAYSAVLDAVKLGGDGSLLLRVRTNPGLSQIQLTLYPGDGEPGARTSLCVYDATGRLVRILLDCADIDRVQRDITWDGSDEKGMPLPAGVYFLQARGGHGKCSRPIRLLR